MKQTTIPEEGIRDARKLGIPRMLLLGLQHMFAMFGATVLVPILVAGYGLPLSIQTTLVFAGLGTLFFHLCTKFKVPAFLGSSFAFLGGFEAVAKLDSGKFAGMTGAEKLPYALGGVVVAGLMYLVLALLVKFIGVKRVMRFLPPVVTGPIIILIGLILAPSAVTNASGCWWLAALSVAVIIVCNIFGKGMIKIVPILLGVVVPYIVALCCGMVDFGAVKDAGVVGLQDFVIAKFDIQAILIMAPIAIATMMEHIGDISAISATVGDNFVEDPGLHRSLIGDGIATAMAGMVVRLAAFFAIILSFSPKFAAIINSVPAAIIGGVSFILYGMISAIGVRNVVENKVDFTNTRNLIIAAVIMVTGLGFNGVGGLTITIGDTAITLTGLALAAIFGIILNAILPGNDYAAEK